MPQVGGSGECRRCCRMTTSTASGSVSPNGERAATNTVRLRRVALRNALDFAVEKKLLEERQTGTTTCCVLRTHVLRGSAPRGSSQLEEGEPLLAGERFGRHQPRASPSRVRRGVGSARRRTGGCSGGRATVGASPAPFMAVRELPHGNKCSLPRLSPAPSPSVRTTSGTRPCPPGSTAASKRPVWRSGRATVSPSFLRVYAKCLDGRAGRP